MKRFLVVLLVLTVSAPVYAHFNVWDFVSAPTNPRFEDISTYEVPLAYALRNGAKLIPDTLRRAVDLEMTLVLAKLSVLAHYPNTNAPTNALLQSSLPSGDTGQREVRWIASFMDEVQSGFPGLSSQVEGWYRGYYTQTFNQSDWTTPVSNGVSEFVWACNLRARQIVAQMALMESKRMTALASDPVFVRTSARVKLGEIPGFMLTAGRQNLNVKVRTGGVAQFYAPLTTLDMAYADIAVGTAGSATAHITGKSQPVLISVGNGTPSVLEVNGNQSFTAPQVAQGLRVWVMAVPTVITHVGNQTLGVGVTQTANFGFGGELLRYSVTSSQPSVCTASLSQDTGIVDLQGVRAGNSTITISATNAAGTAVSSFIATVTASD